LAMPDQGGEIRDIEHLAGIYLPVSDVPADLPDLPPRSHQEHGSSGRRFGGDHGRSSGPSSDSGGYTFYEGEPRRSSGHSGNRGARRPFGGGRPSGGRRPSFGRGGGARRRR